MQAQQTSKAPEIGAKPRPGWLVNRARIGVLAAVMGVIAAFLCLAVIAPPTVDAFNFEEFVLEGSKVPIGGVNGYLINAGEQFISDILGWLSPNLGAGAAELAKFKALDQRNQTWTKLELAHTNAENVGELAQRAITFYERSAYYAAVSLYENQTHNDQAHLYDSDYVLDLSHVSDEMAGSVAGTYRVYNKVLGQLDTVGANYIGDYAKNTLVVGASSYYTSRSSTITYDNQQFLRLASFCNTPVGKYCWLNSTDAAIIWNLDSSTTEGTVTITDSDGVTVHSEYVTLASMGGHMIDFAAIGLESGRYNIALPNARWIWTANAAEDYSGSGTVAPGIAVYARSGDSLTFSWGWAKLPANQGFASSGTWYFSKGEPWKAASTDPDRIAGGYPYLRFGYPDGSNTKYAETVSLQPFIESIWNVSRAWRQTLYGATLAGQTAYQVLVDNAGMGTNGLDPYVLYLPTYIVMPDYDQLNMTAQELLSVYYAYLTQLNETFQHSTIMSPDTINVSTASFNLLIRGTVYYDGVQVIGNNTPFTLYTMLEDLHLKAGETATLTSVGYIVTWADGYSSLMDYLKAKGNVQNPNITYMDVGEGWTIEVEEISFENQIVEEKDLTVDKLRTYVPPDLPPLDPMPQGSDSDGDLAGWLLFGVVVGAILAVVGLLIDRSALLIVGIAIAVVCAAGWYLAENPIDLGLWSLDHAPEYLRMWWRAT